MRSNFFHGIAVTAVVLSLAGTASAQRDQSPERERRATFAQAKTVFQTNTAYDPRIALAVDGVIVHRHGEKLEPLRQSIGSWQSRGFPAVCAACSVGILR